MNGITLSLMPSSLYTPSVANAPWLLVVQNQILYDVIMVSLGASLVAQMVKSLPAVWETGVQSLGWKDPPWRRKWQPTPVFLPGKSHGWKSLVGYSPHGPKELDTTEKLQFFSFYGIFKKRSFLPPFTYSHLEFLCEWVSESCSVVSHSLRPHGLHSPWNSPGQNTGGGSLPFSRGSSQPRDQTQVSCIAGGFFITGRDHSFMVP